MTGAESGGAVDRLGCWGTSQTIYGYLACSWRCLCDGLLIVWLQQTFRRIIIACCSGSDNLRPSIPGAWFGLFVSRLDLLFSRPPDLTYPPELIENGGSIFTNSSHRRCLTYAACRARIRSSHSAFLDWQWRLRVPVRSANLLCLASMLLNC